MIDQTGKHTGTGQGGGPIKVDTLLRDPAGDPVVLAVGARHYHVDISRMEVHASLFERVRVVPDPRRYLSSSGELAPEIVTILQTLSHALGLSDDLAFKPSSDPLRTTLDAWRFLQTRVFEATRKELPSNVRVEYENEAPLTGAEEGFFRDIGLFGALAIPEGVKPTECHVPASRLKNMEGRVRQLVTSPVAPERVVLLGGGRELTSKDARFEEAPEQIAAMVDRDDPGHEFRLRVVDVSSAAITTVPEFRYPAVEGDLLQFLWWRETRNLPAWKDVEIVPVLAPPDQRCEKELPSTDHTYEKYLSDCLKRGESPGTRVLVSASQPDAARMTLVGLNFFVRHGAAPQEFVGIGFQPSVNYTRYPMFNAFAKLIDQCAKVIGIGFRQVERS
jgi:hypothetical protein